MGYEHSKSQNRGGKPTNKQREEKPLSYRMDNVPKVAGPPCLRCGEIINVKLGVGGLQEDGTVNVNVKGSSKSVRNGWVHSGKCEEDATCSPQELFAHAVQQGFVPMEELDA